MRRRLLIGAFSSAVGMFLIAASLILSSFRLALPLGNSLIGGIGVIFLIVGILILATEMVESLLTRSQTMLVDGLQAG